MTELEKRGMIRGCAADTEVLQHGAVLTFDEDAKSLGENDLLLIRSPSGKQLHLVPEGYKGDDLVVAFSPDANTTFHGRLVQMGDRQWRFELEQHHLELLQRRGGTKDLSNLPPLGTAEAFNRVSAERGWGWKVQPVAAGTGGWEVIDETGLPRGHATKEADAAMWAKAQLEMATTQEE